MSGSAPETPPSAQANFFLGSQLSSRFGGGSSALPPRNPAQEWETAGQSRDRPEAAVLGEGEHNHHSADQLFHDTTHVLLPPSDSHEAAETPRSAARRQWEVAIGAEGGSSSEGDDGDPDAEEAAELAQLLASTTNLSMVSSLPGAAGSGRRSGRSEDGAAHGGVLDPGRAYEDAVCELVRASSEFTQHHAVTQLKLSSEQRARTRLEAELTVCTSELADLRARCADSAAVGAGRFEAAGGDTALKAALACDVEALSRQSPDVLAALQASLTSARDAVSDALLAARVAERLQLADSCAICMERPLDTALLSCGHRVCGVCALRLTLCHVCRAPVTARVRVY